MSAKEEKKQLFHEYSGGYSLADSLGVRGLRARVIRIQYPLFQSYKIDRFEG